MVTATATETKVLIVDDSAIVRKVLAEKLNAFPDIEVVVLRPIPLWPGTRSWPCILMC